MRELLTLRIVWAVASVFLCKASFDSFDLNGGFSSSKWIGYRSENLSCPIQINSGVLSGTQECSHKRSFFSLINPLFKRTGVIWSMLLPPNTSLRIRVCFREQEVSMNQQVSDIWRMLTPLLFPVWAFWCWEPDQALKKQRALGKIFFASS